MATTWTLAQLEALEASIAEGTLRVKYETKEVVYRSLDDMLKLRTLMRQALGLEGKGSRLLAKYSKGLIGPKTFNGCGEKNE